MQRTRAAIKALRAYYADTDDTEAKYALTSSIVMLNAINAVGDAVEDTSNPAIRALLGDVLSATGMDLQEAL